MREIKNRCWTGEEMRYDGNYWLNEEHEIVTKYIVDRGDVFQVMLGSDGKCESRMMPPGSVLLEYTGSKDESGKDIFEGDVVQECDEGGLFQVKYDLETACFWFYGIGFNDQLTFDECRAYGSDFLDVKIIGNIYEDTHLLEGDE